MVEIHRKIDKIAFGFFSPQQILKFTVTKIVTPELYDQEGYPVDGGLMDARLGVVDPGLRCKTCGGNLKECPGHFGYIELARPVVHYKLVPHLYAILNMICPACSRVLLPLGEKIIGKNIEIKIRKAKELIRKQRLKKKCPYCKKGLEKIKVEKPTDFFIGEEKINPIQLRAILERIPDEDLRLIGYNPEVFRPESAVLTILLVPPATMRPSIILESGERSEDDLTHKMSDIVRINQKLFENINAGAPEVIIEDLWDLLQYHITTYFDNEVPQIPPARHRGGQVLKTLTDRIKSKEGRIRYNLAGKRTNFSARTVISPDPMISINEVGVPEEVVTLLTVPERVTEQNLDYLRKFVANGNQYPGANYVIRPDGRRKRITPATKEEILAELAPDYIVERHLLNGDISLFNRQPSLHRLSIMGHYVKILPGRTLRLNPTVCVPYNADFDGDEMNLHIPQTEEARSEAETLLLVEKNIVSPRYGLPIIGCIYDSVVGNFLLSQTEFSRKEAIDFLFSLGIEDFSLLPNKKTISGLEILSSLLPKDFSFIGKGKGDNKVEIKKGEFKSGRLDANIIGKEKGVLIKAFYEKYGQKETLHFLEKLFRLGINFVTKKGLSISFSDFELLEKTEKEIKKLVEENKMKVRELISLYQQNKIDVLPGRTALETLELKILEVLNRLRNEVGKTILNEEKKTTLKILINSGARGNIINLAQISGLVGQQALRGKRIEKGFKERTLSYFEKKDLGSECRGHIENSFFSSLLPHEFFFAAMTGRDSLTDTALRTPKSGYLYRRLANTLQDLKIDYQRTVRDANNIIIQFSFGEDGLDVSKTEGGKLNVKKYF